MKMILNTLFLLSCLTALQVHSQPDSLSDLTVSQRFTLGVEQYNKGKFFESIESFESILASGSESFETYYNLGNAYYKTNQLPTAIYYFEKALQLNPRNDDAVFNLKLTNEMLQKDAQAIPEAFHTRSANRLMKLFTPDGWALAGIILFIISLSLLIFFLLQTNQRLKRLFFYLSVVGILMTAISLYSGYRLYSSIMNPESAIIMVSSAGVKSSPDVTSADVYVAEAGMKVKILSTLGEWVEVRVPDGNKGWIMKEYVKLI